MNKSGDGENGPTAVQVQVQVQPSGGSLPGRGLLRHSHVRSSGKRSRSKAWCAAFVPGMPFFRTSQSPWSNYEPGRLKVFRISVVVVMDVTQQHQRNIVRLPSSAVPMLSTGSWMKEMSRFVRKTGDISGEVDQSQEGFSFQSQLQRHPMRSFSFSRISQQEDGLSWLRFMLVRAKFAALLVVPMVPLFALEKTFEIELC